MSLLATEAIVLHAADYLESSRILRLATREAGVQSVIARGARRPRNRFGSALDLFAGGVAHIYVKAGRELNTLSSFEVSEGRPALGRELGRFTAAALLAELSLLFVRDDSNPALYDAVVAGFDRMAQAEPGATREVALAASWQLVRELGFAPSLDQCSLCHAEMDAAAEVHFSHRAGGAVCQRCAPAANRSKRAHPAAGRALPAPARARLRGWLAGEPSIRLSDVESRAHARLLREFLDEHLADGRPLRAFDVWATGGWETR